MTFKNQEITTLKLLTRQYPSAAIWTCPAGHADNGYPIATALVYASQEALDADVDGTGYIAKAIIWVSYSK